MRRADRLFRIVEHLKTRKRVVRAQDLATMLEVSLRTVYRDVADLQMSGVPITGEAGMGYVLDKRHVLQPMMFTREEMEALLLGAQMVRSWGDEALARDSASAMDKIGSVLPRASEQDITGTFLFSRPTREKKPTNTLMNVCRSVIRSKYKVCISYTREDGASSTRVVRPLCLAFFAPDWLLLAWCESRMDFRNFRLDRIAKLEKLTERFKDEKGKRLEDYQKMVGENDSEHGL